MTGRTFAFALFYLHFFSKPAGIAAGSAGAVSLRLRFAEHTRYVAVTALAAPILRSVEVSFYIHRVWRTLENGNRHCRRGFVMLKFR